MSSRRFWYLIGYIHIVWGILVDDWRPALVGAVIVIGEFNSDR